MTYRTILVHLNDKRRVEAILEPAIRLAAQSNAHLIGLHVYAAVPASPVAVPYSAKVLGAIAGAERRETEEIAAAFSRISSRLKLPSISDSAPIAAMKRWKF